MGRPLPPLPNGSQDTLAVFQVNASLGGCYCSLMCLTFPFVLSPFHQLQSCTLIAHLLCLGPCLPTHRLTACLLACWVLGIAVARRLACQTLDPTVAGSIPDTAHFVIALRKQLFCIFLSPPVCEMNRPT